MLIICKHLEHPIYDNIQHSIKEVYDIDTSYNENIIMNAVPIKYNDEYYIFANLAKLEISALSLTNSSYGIEYIVNEELRGNITINKVASVHEINSKVYSYDGDCFYDEHLNIMFIKFQDIRIEYIEITFNSFTFDNLYKLNEINIKFEWLNNLLEIKTIHSYKNKLIFHNEFIDLPHIPIISSESKSIDELCDSDLINYPCTGATVFSDTGNFIGIVSYSDKDAIITMPLILIKRTLKYLNHKSISKIDLITYPIQIKYDDDLIDYGLYYKKKLKKYEKIHCHNIIMSIDDYLISSDGNLIIKNLEIPLTSYLWLNTNHEKIKIKSISKNLSRNIRVCKEQDIDNSIIYYINLKEEKKDITFGYYGIKINKNYKKSFTVSELNYIKYKDKIMLELNEKIMQFLKPIIQTTDNLDYLYDYVIKKNKYNEKIFLILDNRLNIKLIYKINNIKIKYIGDVFKMFKTKKEVGFFIENF